MRGQLLPPERARNDLKQNPEAVLKAFLEELGPLIGPKDGIEAMRFVKAKDAEGDQVRIQAMQVAKGIPIHGASLVLYADAERGVFARKAEAIVTLRCPRWNIAAGPSTSNSANAIYGVG